MDPLRDTLDRPIADLRVSVTDRCNFRCTYCMPKEVFGRDYAFLPRADLLTFEEIARLVRVFAPHGVRKVRLTGGEPTMRKGLPDLVRMLADVPGVEVTLTTNGSLLEGLAAPLRAAGLHRLTVSLDSLDDAVFARMNDVAFPVSRVLDGLAAAQSAGFPSIKVNCVVRRGVNEDSVLPLCRRFKGTGHVVRFIEFMDVGNTNGWRLDQVVPSRELVARIGAELPIEPADPSYYGEVAGRWRYRDGSGEIGLISSVTQPFCRSCTRARLSAEGKLFTCLFAAIGVDFRGPLRSGAADAEIEALLAKTWAVRGDRYSELRTAETAGLKKVEMSYIGG